MGKGKGAPDHWVAVVRPGKVLFEMEGVTPVEIAQEAMRSQHTSFRSRRRLLCVLGFKVEVAAK